ncbi:hypothetical protein FRB91_011767 [Serendipita sp. 411]|nr:hypothetical protein FRB91_011767 [Serendipita sp. 411]
MQSVDYSPSKNQQFSGSPQEILLPPRTTGNRISVETPFAHEFSIELSGALDSMDPAGPAPEDMVNFDPEVLASLVVQLRSNMASAIRERDEMRGERDDLIRDLAITQTRLQDLEGSQEREVQLLNEMSSWRKRCEDAEEQIVMLRQKVEESRRAVMTLQTQSRRVSQLSQGFGSPHGSPHAQTFGSDVATKTSPYQKRMSLQVGSPGSTFARGRHRRQTSLSEPSIDANSVESESSHAPSAQADAPTQEQDQSTARNSLSRRQSTAHTRPTESLLNPYAAEMEALRQELIGVRMELIDSKRELWEANEAKEASDVCLKALKEFIAENNIGDAPPSAESAKGSSPLRGISLPPLPTDNIDHLGDDEDTNLTPIATRPRSTSTTTKRGWGLGFWGMASTPVVGGSTPTGKAPSSGHDSVSHSSSPSQAVSTKSPIVPVGPISSLVSKWRKIETPSSSSESVSSVHATTSGSGTTHSTKSSIASAFRWTSQGQTSSQSEPSIDNYTPAPRPGGLKRRPSAYSVNRTQSEPIQNETSTTIFSYDRQDSIQLYSEDEGMVSESTDEFRLSPQSMDSPLTTIPLTDTESATTNPSNSGSDREPDSPASSRISSLQVRTPSSWSVNQPPLPTLEVNERPATGIGLEIRSNLQIQSESNSLPAPPISPRTPLSPGMRVAHSPTTQSPKLGSTLTVESRPRGRSRAASNAVMMERIDEVAATASVGLESAVKGHSSD